MRFSGCLSAGSHRHSLPTRHCLISMGSVSYTHLDVYTRQVKQDVWEENWKAMRLYSVVALVAFGVITLVSVFSLSIGKYKWVYLVYTFLSLVYFCISRCQLRSFLGKKLVVYSFFAALLLFGIITGTLIIPEELTVNYIVFMMTAPLLLSLIHI